MSDIEKEISDFIEKQDIKKGVNFLERVTNALFKLTQSLNDNNVKVKYHQHTLEGKYFRFGLANHSYISLVKGTSYQLFDKPAYTPDLFSIISLLRMQMESYLIMHYLFFDNISETEKSLRFDIYKIHGLQKQLKFNIENITNENRKKRTKIKTELDEVVTHLRKNHIFINYTESKKEKLLNPPNATLIKPKDLHEKSGLTKTRMNQFWQLCSNYVHGEYISDRQFNNIYGNKNRDSLSNTVSLQLSYLLMLTSKLIVNIAETFDSAKNELVNLDNDTKFIVETWKYYLVND